MPRVDIQLRGEEEALSRLHHLASNTEHAEPMFEDVFKIVLEAEQFRWKKNGGGGKQRWNPLADKTIAKKRREGRDNGILRSTGALEKSLTVAGGTGQIKKIDRYALIVGTSLRYAYYHQNGKEHYHREVLGINPKFKKMIREKVFEHLTDGKS